MLTKAIEADTVRALKDCGWTLIPLHRWNDKAKDGKQAGKRPLDFGWQRREYSNPAVINRCITEGRNIGIRPNGRQLVIDVDPRNKGDKSFARLCRKLELDSSRWPCSLTGSGGHHYFLTLPEGVRMIDTHPDYRGVEFKSVGRQVVAPGSRHPNGTLYEWDWLESDRLPLEEAPAAPAALIELIRRPVTTGERAEGGEATPEQIERLLTKLDVTKFSTNEDWEPLLMAVHHASDGEARQEFIAWSIRDPIFSDRAEDIGRRWDSLSRKREGGRTVGTLNHILREHGLPNLQIAGDASKDFDAVQLTSDDEHNEGSWLDKMNREYCAVIDGNRFRIVHPIHDPDVGIIWQELSESDFCATLRPFKVEIAGKNGPTTKSKAEAWLEHPNRRFANGVKLDPSVPPREVFQTEDGTPWLNQWNGWGLDPVNREWEGSLLRRMTFEVLCSGNKDHYLYLMNWLAWKVQNPGEPSGVAVALRGEKGVGKTTLGETMVRIFGSHGIALNHIDHLAGRFSGHLKTACFVFGDETVWGGDKQQEGTLKKLITDPQITIEAKFKDRVRHRNHMAIMLATNADWAVPASLTDERRFFVLDVSTCWQVPADAKDHPNRQKWNQLYEELDRKDGRGVLLHHLMNRKIGKFHPRDNVPQTKALAENKIRGLEGIPRWYHDCLQDGSILVSEGVMEDWEKGPITVKPTDVLESCRAAMRGLNKHASLSKKGLFQALKPYGWTRGRARTAKRDRLWCVPQLSVAQQKFREIGKLPFNPFTEEDSESE